MAARVLVSGRWYPIDEILDLLDRVYRRDKNGRFSSGGAGGVRESLANASTAEAVGTAAAAEAKQLTGRDIPFDFTGSDVQIAREHAEGVLRVMEKYPEVAIMRVRTSPLAGQDPTGATPFARVSGDDVVFSREFASDPTAYRATLAMAEETGFYASGHASPMAIGIHEAAHLTGPEWETGHRASGIAIEAAVAGGHGQTVESASKFVSDRLGSYATTNGAELTAIAVTDVLLHGDSSSSLAHDVKTMNDEEYRKVIGG